MPFPFANTNAHNCSCSFIYIGNDTGIVWFSAFKIRLPNILGFTLNFAHAHEYKHKRHDEMVKSDEILFENKNIK